MFLYKNKSFFFWLKLISTTTKETLTEEETAKVAELEAMIKALSPTVKTEGVKDDTPSKEAKTTQKVEELTSRVRTLETELKNTPNTITVSGGISKASDLKVGDKFKYLDKDGNTKT